MATRGHFNEYGQCISRASGMGKRTFSSKKEAKRHAKIQATKHANNKILEAYKCPHCGYWHLGH